MAESRPWSQRTGRGAADSSIIVITTAANAPSLYSYACDSLLLRPAWPGSVINGGSLESHLLIAV